MSPSPDLRLLSLGAGVQSTTLALLHRSRIPLSVAPIDHVTAAERRENAAAAQLDLLDELGDPDGCSPYGCRSGASV